MNVSEMIIAAATTVATIDGLSAPPLARKPPVASPSVILPPADLRRNPRVREADGLVRDRSGHVHPRVTESEGFSSKDGKWISTATPESESAELVARTIAGVCCGVIHVRFEANRDSRRHQAPRARTSRTSRLHRSQSSATRTLVDAPCLQASPQDRRRAFGARLLRCYPHSSREFARRALVARGQVEVAEKRAGSARRVTRPELKDPPGSQVRVAGWGLADTVHPTKFSRSELLGAASSCRPAAQQPGMVRESVEGAGSGRSQGAGELEAGRPGAQQGRDGAAVPGSARGAPRRPS